MRRLAYIPARGGSKGIQGKNIADLGGRPLVACAVDVARQSGVFDKIMVSTDSEEIATIAREYGAWVPFLRYSEYAQDNSKTIDAVCSDKERLEKMGELFDELVLLQCTSPFRTVEDVIGAVSLAERVGAGVVSITPVEEHPILMRTIGFEGKLVPIMNCSGTCRRQDMPLCYKVNGAIYVNFWDEISPSLSFNDNPYGFVMRRAESLDIDTVEDLEKARKMVSK